MSVLSETLSHDDTKTVRDGASSAELERWSEYVADEELLRPLHTPSQQSQAKGAWAVGASAEVRYLPL